MFNVVEPTVPVPSAPEPVVEPEQPVAVPPAVIQEQQQQQQQLFVAQVSILIDDKFLATKLGNFKIRTLNT